MKLTEISTEDAPRIEFPVDDYMIKIVAEEHDEYRGFVAGVLVKYDARVTVESFREAPSKNGKYVSLTVFMRIEEEQHLKDLFEELKTNSRVKMVL